MNGNDIPDQIVRVAVSSGFTQISYIWSQVQVLLAGTEVYDAELSLQVTEAYKAFEVKVNDLLRDSLHRQGISDEQIAQRAEEIKRMLGF